MICVLPRILPLIETLVNSVLDLEDGLSTKGDDTVAWLKIGEFPDSFMFNVQSTQTLILMDMQFVACVFQQFCDESEGSFVATEMQLFGLQT